MATWVMHLRVAEKVKKYLGEVDETAYYVGSIAPDSGRMVDNFTYSPPKDVSHWKRDDVSYEQRFIDNYAFFEKYGKNETDPVKRSLFLGYYVHILTDTVFVRDIIQPFMDKHDGPFWRANIDKIRAGWYELDFRFLVANPNFHPIKVIGAVEDFPNDCLDYFERGDFTERMKNCAELYSNPRVNPNQEFLTIDKARQDKLAEEMTDIIVSELKKYNII